MTTGMASLWPEHELAALAAPGAERRPAADERRGLRLTSQRWWRLYVSRPADWNAATLRDCTAEELEALCRLLGIAYSGTRDERCARLLDMAALRGELATWGEFQGVAQNAHSLASAIATRYRKPALVALARRAGLFVSTSKVGLIIGLLQWRDSCRRRGTAFNDEIRRALASQPAKQQALFLSTQKGADGSLLRCTGIAEATEGESVASTALARG